MRGEEKGTAGAVQGKTKVSFINIDDTFIQPAHSHPSSHPVIKHDAASHTSVSHPTFFESMHFVLHRAEIYKQRPWCGPDVLNLMYSGGLCMDLRENWVALGHMSAMVLSTPRP